MPTSWALQVGLQTSHGADKRKIATFDLTRFLDSKTVAATCAEVDVAKTLHTCAILRHGISPFNSV